LVDHGFVVGNFFPAELERRHDAVVFPPEVEFHAVHEVRRCCMQAVARPFSWCARDGRHREDREQCDHRDDGEHLHQREKPAASAQPLQIAMHLLDHGATSIFVSALASL
jgi:hypothetical protein